MLALSADALEWIAVGALVTVAGALIKFRGWTFLLAGYDESVPVSEDTVQNVAGNTVLRVGIAVFAFGVLRAALTLPSYLGALIGAAIVLEVARMVYRVNAQRPAAT
ncbi:DUF3784 domain-containing protein [Haloarcula pelagica]|uniref:DUF3784 domain-containing protein n=1 Tax=Haloarcula pelagica TaxID=3033389 RepID=UPI0024C4321A|nr:DUF3784 domain-containing protein [Halomicroarcula sp. YJ-61-S]